VCSLGCWRCAAFILVIGLHVTEMGDLGAGCLRSLVASSPGFRSLLRSFDSSEQAFRRGQRLVRVECVWLVDG
jgi:hypothetical protein